MANLHIDNTLAKIGEVYRPGLLVWMKGQPGQWSKLLLLEGNINKTTLTGDEPGLKAALSAYKDFITDMLKSFDFEGD